MASFFIALFVLMMQFLWLWIDDIIGKGVGIFIILELLGYLLFTFIPLSIPIAILIASVMVFGTLGENYELSSFKSAGISLTRIMRMTVVIGIFLGVFSYLSANYIIPSANLKYRSRLFDIKKQKPTLNIEPGIFNYDFTGYAIRVKDKSRNNRDLEEVLIYDFAQSNPSKVNMITAERGEMYVSDNERFLIMKLYNGYQVQESEKIEAGTARPVFTRGKFDEFEKIFDLSEFEISRTDEDLFRNHQSMLSGKLLKQVIDSVDINIQQQKERVLKDLQYDGLLLASVTQLKDRLNEKESKIIADRSYSLIDQDKFVQSDSIELDTITRFIYSFSGNAFADLIPLSRTKMVDMRSRLMITQSSFLAAKERRSKHVFEYHQKFVFGAVCVIFLFIGVSLGAIVRKGGYGYPLLIAIIFFMIFISAQTTFKKLAETQKMNDILASWAPCLVLAPFAIWFTYKAQRDAKFINLKLLWEQIKDFLPSRPKKQVNEV